MVLAKEFFEEHALRFQFVFAHCLGINFESRLQVLVPENLLHCLDMDFHVYQDRSKRSAKSVEAKRAWWSDHARFAGCYAQVIGNQHVAAGGFFPFRRTLGKRDLRLRGRASPCATQEDMPQAGDASAQVPSTPELRMVSRIWTAARELWSRPTRVIRLRCSFGGLPKAHPTADP